MQSNIYLISFIILILLILSIRQSYGIFEDFVVLSARDLLNLEVELIKDLIEAPFEAIPATSAFLFQLKLAIRLREVKYNLLTYLSV